MTIVLKKKNTTWTFNEKGAYMTNGSGTIFPHQELRLGSPNVKEFIEYLENNKYQRLDTQLEPVVQ